MSHVKRYLDTRKAGRAHDVARIVAALAMNGWQDLAEAIEQDFAAPSLAEQLADFFTTEEATKEELYEVCDELSTQLEEDQQRDLAARILCRVNGLDPDEKTDGEKAGESQAETLAAFDAAKVDAGPRTL